MQLLTPTDAAARVTSALKSAADATGAGFDYLLRTAQRESSLNPSAKAPTSSARGLFQFIDQTWLQVLKEDGPKLGLGAEAADVSRSASGRYTVADPDRRAELLALRNDPTASALLAGAFTRRNAQTVQSQIGRPATDGELYVAHFLGAQGAVDLIKLAVNQPGASAAAAFPAQASSNRAIFYDNGRQRTAGEVYARLTAGGSATTTATTALAMQETTSRTDEIAPFNAGVENDGQAFHSLFKTGRRSPVSAYVTQAWSSFGSAGLASDVGSPLRKVASAGSAAAAAAPALSAAHAYAPTAATAVPASAASVPTVEAAAAAKTRRRVATNFLPANVPAASVATAGLETFGSPLDLAAFKRASLKIISPAAPQMIVERYLEWAESAPAPVRAEAAGALARSYLYGDLEPSIRADIELALIGSLDDPSLGVRCAIAEAFAGSSDAPQALVLALASDAPDVAVEVLSRSPLLSDVELVDLVAQGGVRGQVAIARRKVVSAPLCAAIAEVGRVEACAALVENSGARLTRSVAARLAERHGADAAVRAALLERLEVGPDVRQILMRSVAASLQSFVTARGWLTPDRARRAAEDACDRGALSIAATEPNAHGFVRHLIARGEFSARSCAPGAALRQRRSVRGGAVDPVRRGARTRRELRARR